MTMEKRILIMFWMLLPMKPRNRSGTGQAAGDCSNGKRHASTGDEPASVPDENPPVVVEAAETALPQIQRSSLHRRPSKETTTAHKNFRRFQELFPEIVSGQYEYLRLEAGEAYYPLSFTINTVPITAWSITICRTATGCMTLIWTSKSTKRLGHFGLSVMRTAALVYITRLIPTTPHTRKQSTGSTVSLHLAEQYPQPRL
jgi:hypothetical protein